MTAHCSVIGLPILWCHPHGFGVGQHPLDFTLLLLQCPKEMFCCIRSSVFDWLFCLAITSHHNVAVTASLMVLRFLSVALRRVEVRSFNFCGESFEVGIYDVGCRQLLVVVLEGELVLTLFWHFHPDSCLSDSLTFWLVVLQQVFPGIAMETALTEVLLLSVLALIIEKATEVLYPGVVELASLLNQQEIVPRHVFRLFADVVYNNSLVPTNDG